MYSPDTVVNGRYRIVRRLDSAPGETYEAHDEAEGRLVTVQAWEIPDVSARERITHAAQSWRKNTHPSLPAVIDHFSDRERYLLVTDRTEAPSLAERMQVRGEPFSPPDVLRWGEALLDAVVSLHRQSPTLPHGQINADNMRETSSGLLRLSGIDLYTVGGTHAPAEEEDVYDVAATLYYLLTGVKPPTLQGRAARGFLPSVSSLNPEVPQPLSQLLAQGLSDNPADRFRSAYAFLNALRRVQAALTDATTYTVPATPPSLAAKLQRRRDEPTASVAAVADSEDALSPADQSTHGPATNPEALPESPLPRSAIGEPTASEPERGPDEFEEPGAGGVSVSDPAPATFTFEPQPIAAEAQIAGGDGAPAESHKLSLGDPVQGSQSEQDHSQTVPPESAVPLPPPPANKNRAWMAVGIGCTGALLCVCCGLLAFASTQWNSIVRELESSGITLEEPPSGTERPDTPAVGNNGEESPVESGVTVSVFELNIGDCFNDPSSTDLVEELTLLDCNAPHDNEVFAFGNYPASENDEFPAESDLDEFSESYCAEEFEAYVGLPYSDSIYYIYYLQPTEASWEDGDREIVCILYDRDGKVEGSKAGSSE